MEIVITQAALVDIAEIEAWWEEHRTKAPMLFTDELHGALERLTAFPRASTRVAPTVRRVLLSRSHYHVHYRLEPERVVVLGVTGASTMARPRR